MLWSASISPKRFLPLGESMVAQLRRCDWAVGYGQLNTTLGRWRG